MIIDSHVNLHAPQFDEDRDEVIARAREAGVRLMVEISDKLSTFEATHALAMANDDIWCTVGAHPHEAKDHVELTADELVALAQRPRVIGIGECGLDFHYDLSPRDEQAAVFRQHIEAARRTGLPLVVHTREADDVMAAILREEHAKGSFKLLMHCYTSGLELAETAAELGAGSRFPVSPPSRRRKTCERSFAGCPRTVSSSRPTAPIWRPSPTGAAAMNRPMSAWCCRSWRK